MGGGGWRYIRVGRGGWGWVGIFYGWVGVYIFHGWVEMGRYFFIGGWG